MAQLDTIIENANDPIFGYEAFEQIVLNAPVAISITDKNGKILFVNQTFCDITEYSVTDLIGCNSSLLSYKATPRSVYESLWSAISNGQHWHGQLINKKNLVFHISPIFLSRVLPIKTENTAITRSRKTLLISMKLRHIRKTSTPCFRQY